MADGEDGAKAALVAQMFDQLQKQQSMFAATLMPNGMNVNATNGSSMVLGPGMQAGQIFQDVTTPDRCYSQDDDGGEGDHYAMGLQMANDAIDSTNPLLYSCDCGDDGDHLTEHGGDDCDDDCCSCYSYYGDGIVLDQPDECHQVLEVEDDCCDTVTESECFTTVGCSIDVECVKLDHGPDDCGCACVGERKTILTIKDETGETKVTTTTISTQTGPTSESKAVQAIELKNVACETDPLPEPKKPDSPIEEVFEKILKPPVSELLFPCNPVSHSHPHIHHHHCEPEPLPAKPKTPPAPLHDPIRIKFDLGLRVDEVRDLPHLLAAPHGNTEHYCAYCAPDNETLVRPPMLVKVRLSVYDRATGHLANCDDGVVNSETNWALTNVRHNRYVFGRQSAVFHRATVSQDAILIVRIYARKKRNLLHIDPAYSLIIRQPMVDVDETDNVEEELLGWAMAPVFQLISEADNRGENADPDLPKSVNGEVWRLKTGLQLLPVYCPPVPIIVQLPPQHRMLEAKEQWKNIRPLGAHSRVAVWLGRGAFTNLDDSDESEDENDDIEVRVIDKRLWVDGGALPRPAVPFTSEDGFDLYVDSARCLPDFVTVTRVAIRIAQATHTKAASDEFCHSQLDSDIFNPIYDFRQEYRNLAREVVPRSTLTFKIYTIDRFTQRLTVVGYAYLNLFNILGVVAQPVVDEGVQISLNDGSFQLRIYATPPNTNTPLSMQLPIVEKHRAWPCATLLVRIVKAPRDDFGHIMSTKNVPQNKWIETGLFRPRPTNYTTGSYYSQPCRPTPGERQTFATFRRRLPFKVRKAVIEIGKRVADRTIPADNDNLLQSVLERLLSRFGADGGSSLPHGNLNYAAAYDPVYGFAVSIDGAIGLPWAGATLGHLVVNPPGAHYMGPPYSRFDIPRFMTRLDLNAPPSQPKWIDGFFTFKYRSGQRMQSTGMRMATVVIVHLQEVTLRRTYVNLEYGLSSEAWTAVPIFAGGSSFAHPYVANEKLLLPLFSGSPNVELLKEMSSEVDFNDWLDRCIHVKKIHPVVGARLNVRVCDGRRIEECAKSNDILPVNHSLVALPSIMEAEPPSVVPLLPLALTQVPMKSYLANLVASDQKLLEKIVTTLPTKYRQMVYKLYYTGGKS